ncbi:MAG: DUF3796 domain-containing protein [Firmicutes bacterium]|jgi:hypothetical protein|nr:DUF3796 domain-containing protein [Bacillota bacterium]
MSKKTLKYLGFLGFLGFGGFQFFVTGRTTDISQFAFFAFFAYFWIAKLSVGIPDERYFYNVQQAQAFVGNLAVLEAAALFLLSIAFSRSTEVLVFGIALLFASLIIGFAVKLYQLEEK